MLRLGRNDSISLGAGEMEPRFQTEKHQARMGVVEAEPCFLPRKQQGGGEGRGFGKEEPRKHQPGGSTLEAPAFFLPAGSVVVREGQTAQDRR